MGMLADPNGCEEEGDAGALGMEPDEVQCHQLEGDAECIDEGLLEEVDGVDEEDCEDEEDSVPIMYLDPSGEVQVFDGTGEQEDD